MSENLIENSAEAQGIAEPFALAFPSMSSQVSVPDDSLHDIKEDLADYLDRHKLNLQGSHTTNYQTQDTNYHSTTYTRTVSDYGNQKRQETDYKQDSEVIHKSDEKEDWHE